ncbi:hypothetical protein ACWGCW_35620 [Streptomyces sp. NPDC054933]
MATPPPPTMASRPGTALELVPCRVQRPGMADVLVGPVLVVELLELT